MKTIITLKNHCLKAFESIDRSGSSNSSSSSSIGGFNPSYPSSIGGFVGDLHVGKHYDTIGKFEPSELRRVKSTISTLSFNYEYQGKSLIKELEVQ